MALAILARTAPNLWSGPAGPRLDAPVLVVEGEKAADAVRNIFPDYVAVTSSGGARAAAKADWSPLAGRAVTIWPDADAPGRDYAAEAAQLIQQAGAATVAIVNVPAELPEAWDLADDLPADVTHADLQAMIDGARPMPLDEGPLPLRRALPEPEPFPIDALGEVLRPAAEAIHDLTQAPLAVCGQSVLAAATLAVQAHADVILPMGSARPTSCFFITVAASGERKTSCDDLALKPVRDFLDGMRHQHSADLTDWRNRLDLWKAGREKILKSGKGDKGSKSATEADLRELGAEPAPPPEPRIICGEPTIEGLFKLLRNGLGFVGLFSAEGGSFVGGHGMSQDNKLKTAAYLSSLWDGTAIDRTRAGDDLIILHGRRLTAHLMLQPSVAETLLSDAELIGQGLLSRALVTAPISTAGLRLWRDPSHRSGQALLAYGNRVMALLQRPRAHAEGCPAELTPKGLVLSVEARQLWIAYHDTIETQSGPQGALASIAGLAAKLPEHAARLAAVLAMTDDPNVVEIEGDYMAAGIALAQHYQTEALRLFEAGFIDPDLKLAERVLDFIRERGGVVSPRCVYQKGPNAARDKETALRLLKILEDHRWIRQVEGGAEIDGRTARDVWRLVR